MQQLRIASFRPSVFEVDGAEVSTGWTTDQGQPSCKKVMKSPHEQRTT